MAPREEEFLRLLADTTNRAVLTVLDGAERGLSVAAIAERIVSQDGPSGSSEYEDELEGTIISLHHNHLPRLESAGLVEYDPETNVVSSGNASSIDAEWMDFGILDELLSRFRIGAGADESAVGLLEGRESVYEYCRNAADTAEHELFLIYSSDELLNEDCLPQAKEAVERGVEFYAGAKSRDAREFFRESLPEATIWDPQVDWMYDQSNCPTISRLVVVDRETVAVGLWKRAGEGEKTEVAMIGEGETNPLVVLVRELLGSRLDHLDYQSDDFMGNLPFDA